MSHRFESKFRSSCVTLSLCGMAILSFTPARVRAQVDTAWVRTFNGTSAADFHAEAVAVSREGNVYLCGERNLGFGHYDIALAAYRRGGELLWRARNAGPWGSYNQVAAIAVDDSDIRNFDCDTGTLGRDGSPLTVEKHFLIDHIRRLYFVERLEVDPKPTMPNRDEARFNLALAPHFQEGAVDRVHRVGLAVGNDSPIEGDVIIDHQQSVRGNLHDSGVACSLFFEQRDLSCPGAAAVLAEVGGNRLGSSRGQDEHSVAHEEQAWLHSAKPD